MYSEKVSNSYQWPEEIQTAILTGTQRCVPNKRPGEPTKLVLMTMALLRFKPTQTDILITLNTEVEQECAQIEQSTHNLIK